MNTHPIGPRGVPAPAAAGGGSGAEVLLTFLTLAGIALLIYRERAWIAGKLAPVAEFLRVTLVADLRFFGRWAQRVLLHRALKRKAARTDWDDWDPDRMYRPDWDAP